MFAFLSRFLNDYPTIYLIICCLMACAWLYISLHQLAETANRLDIHLAQKPTIQHQSDGGIAWIDGNVRLVISICPSFGMQIKMCIDICAAPIECNRFSTNIDTHSADKCFTNGAPLTWHGFDVHPLRMRLQNTSTDGNSMQMTEISVASLRAGKKLQLMNEFPFDLRIVARTSNAIIQIKIDSCLFLRSNIVRMTAIYGAGNIPYVSGCAVDAKYLFRAIRFTIAPSIEHRLNGRLVDVEMQLLAESVLMPNRFLIFSWFLVEDKSKNYSLEPLLKWLKFVRPPHQWKQSESHSHWTALLIRVPAVSMATGNLTPNTRSVDSSKQTI